MHDLTRRRSREPSPEGRRSTSPPASVGARLPAARRHRSCPQGDGTTSARSRERRGHAPPSRSLRRPAPGEIGQRRVDRVIPRVIADPHARVPDHPNDARVPLNEVAHHEERPGNMEPLEDVHDLLRLSGPRTVVERQRDVAVRDAATDRDVARGDRFAGDGAFDRDPPDAEAPKGSFRVPEMPTREAFDDPAGPLDPVGSLLHQDGVAAHQARLVGRRSTVQLDPAGCDRGIDDRAGDRQELSRARFESVATPPRRRAWSQRAPGAVRRPP